MSDKIKYIAITIGPITRTIEMAENTRGLWAASYLFSYLGKQIIEPFKKRTFLLPKISDELFSEKYNGAGIFPDRYIFKAEDGDYEKLTKHVNCVYQKLATNIANEIGKVVDNIEIFLRDYIKVFFFEKEFLEMVNVKDIKESCEQSLALLEMQDAIVPQTYDADAYMNQLFDRATHSFLTEDAGLKKGFPTIVKISSGENTEKPQHPYQRYFAIVYGDGDSMGKALEKIDDANKLSAALLEFNKQATTVINNYQGLPVYTGGDDLLFFAPVFTEDKGTIFALLQELDDVFHQCIKDKVEDSLKENEHPSLSFGVSITYYKYPMFEALKLAESLLKEAKYSRELKNNIAFSVQKHSGQTRAAILNKGYTETLENFNKFLKKYLLIEEPVSSASTQDDKKNAKKMLLSVMHGIQEKKFILSVAIKDENTLENFFTNNFNEPIHKEQRFKSFFDDMKQFMVTANKEYKNSEVALELVYNALQLIHLINQRNDERD